MGGNRYAEYESRPPTYEAVRPLFSILSGARSAQIIALLDEGPKALFALAKACGVDCARMRDYLSDLRRLGLVQHPTKAGPWFLVREGLGPAIDWLSNLADTRKAARDLGIVGTPPKPPGPWEPPTVHSREHD